LAKWQPLALVETLYLTKVGATEKGVGQLLDVPMLALEKLCLSSNNLGDGIAGVLVSRAKNIPHLKRLELKNTGVESDAVATLMKTAKLPHLARLDVRGN